MRRLETMKILIFYPQDIVSVRQTFISFEIVYTMLQLHSFLFTFKMAEKTLKLKVGPAKDDNWIITYMGR